MEPVIDAPPTLYDLPGFHEPFSAISHLSGAALFLVLNLLLLRRGQRYPPGLPYLIVYVISVQLLLIASGLYHMVVRGSDVHAVIERIDHSAIFILIAGTFTPVHGILFTGWRRWAPLALIWTAALLGIIVKLVYLRAFAHWAGVTLYLAIGWFGLVSGILAAHRYGLRFIQLPVIGGIAYSIGAVIDAIQGFTLIPGVIHPHELLHVFVLLGIWSHWLFMWQIADGRLVRDGS